MIKYGTPKEDLEKMKQMNEAGVIEKDAELDELIAKKKAEEPMSGIENYVVVVAPRTGNTGPEN